jgi:hypothetical protein
VGGGLSLDSTVSIDHLNSNSLLMEKIFVFNLDSYHSLMLQ